MIAELLPDLWDQMDFRYAPCPHCAERTIKVFVWRGETTINGRRRVRWFARVPGLNDLMVGRAHYHPKDMSERPDIAVADGFGTRRAAIYAATRRQPARGNATEDSP